MKKIILLLTIFFTVIGFSNANEANIFNFEAIGFDFHRFDFVEFQQKYKFSFYLLRAPPLLKV